MKQFKKLLIAAILFIGANQISIAQTKVAHVDTNEIMTKMPAVLDANKQLQTLSTTYDTDYKKMVEEYQAKLTKYQNEAAAIDESKQTAEAKKAYEATYQQHAQELQDMQKRIGDYRDNAQKELQQKQEEIMKPIMEKVKASIQKIGRAKGFQYVIDAASAILTDGTNITPDVKKDLGF